MMTNDEIDELQDAILRIDQWHQLPKLCAQAKLANAQGEAVALQFPTMLRKMWSGGEVQRWLDELPPMFAHPPMPDSLPDEAKLICPRCGADRYKEPCKYEHLPMSCPMTGVAQNIDALRAHMGRKL